MRPIARRRQVARSRRAAVLVSAAAVAIHGCADESVYFVAPDADVPTSGGGAGAPADVAAETGGAAGAAGATDGLGTGTGTGGGHTRGGDAVTTGAVFGGTVDPGSGGAGQLGQAGEAGAGGAAPSVALEGRPCEGYTLIGSPENDAGADFSAFLIDMDGNEVHRWTITGFPPKMLPEGSLIGCTGVFPSSYDCLEMVQVSWDGERQWSFDDWADLGDGQTAARQHHDFQREGNPVGYYAPGREFVAD